MEHAAPERNTLSKASIGADEFYDCRKGADYLSWRLEAQKARETVSPMIPNPKPPAVRQRLLFSPAVRRLVDLPSDKQHELKAAIAELLLNALTDDDPIDNGETDDKS
jgi:hypothetical protein